MKNNTTNNTPKTSKMINPINTALALIPQEIREDISNAREMVRHGFVSNDLINVQPIINTAPKDLALFEKSMDEQGRVCFYVIELDRNEALKRGLWVAGGFIICQLSLGRCVPFYQNGSEFIIPGSDYQKEFKHLKTFWRKADYETARKSAARIWCINQKDHTNEIATKQEKRELAKDGALNRYTISDFALIRNSEGLGRIERLIAKSDRGQVKTFVGWGSYYYISREDYKYKTDEEAIASRFDKSGYNLTEVSQGLPGRLVQLKRERARQRLTANNYEKETAELSSVYGLLVKSFKDLTDKFLDLTNNNKKHRVFYFIQRLDATADTLQSVAECIDRITDKHFDGDLTLYDAFKKEKDQALKVIAKNHAWLNIKDEERANDDNLKDYALYYGYLDFTRSENGDVNGVILDLEKAQAKRSERGW